MDLQTMFSDLLYGIDFYILPFLTTLVFIAFLVNVIRYFIINSDSDDGRESARRYMVWSMVGFVLILALWGVINLLLSMLGFNTFGGIVCPDYDPTCNPSGINVTTSLPGGGFGSGPITPTSPGVTIPGTGGGSPTTPTTPGLSTPGGSDTTPTAPGTTAGNYSNVGSSIQSRVANSVSVPNSFLSNQLAQISMSGVADDSRLRMAAAFASAGIITQAELSQIVVDVNLVRQASGQPPLSLNTVGSAGQQYVNNIQTMYQNIPTVNNYLVAYYQSNGLPQSTAQTNAAADMQNIFRTNNTFATRVNTASNIMMNVMEGDPDHPAFAPLFAALNAEAGYAGCSVTIDINNFFTAPCG